MKRFDRIKWQYLHCLNSCSSLQRVKMGIFVSDGAGLDKNGNRLCYVLFDDNCTTSKILRADCIPDTDEGGKS